LPNKALLASGSSSKFLHKQIWRFFRQSRTNLFAIVSIALMVAIFVLLRSLGAESVVKYHLSI
jgi:hypothetical protein